jgi:hypothetical protein
VTTDKISILRSDLLDGFPKTSPPKFGEITVETTLDGKKISSDLESNAWWEISTEVLRANYDALPLLTPQAYHYYLPAYLLAALENLKPHDSILEFTVYSLSPT